jgi:CheY-like chemotaxis protein
MPPPRVLVAEDEPDALRLLELLLAVWGYEVISARNGVEALEQCTPPPDLLLTDISMPEMDGIELCRRFRANPQLKDVPIIALTALPRLPAALLGLVEAHFQKPPELERLRHALAFYAPVE